MKIHCHRPELATAFQTVGSVVPSRTPKDILKNVKLQVENGKAILIGTDQEVGIRYEIPGVEVEAGGETLLPATRVSAILRELQEDKVDLELEGESAWIRSGQSEFQLAGQDAAEFPPVPEFEDDQFVTIQGKVLRNAIKKTIFATDIESSRYALGGVLVVFNDQGFKMVATDSRRLALVSECYVSQNIDGLDNLKPVIPRNAMLLIERSIPNDEAEIQLAIHDNDVLVRCGNSTIYARLVEGRFPHYENVIPEEVPHVIDIMAGQFFSAVRQSQIVTSDESRGVDFEFGNGVVSLQSKAADVGQSKIEMPISFEGEPLVITFDPRYVADFLKVLDPETSFQFKIRDHEGAAVLSSGDSYLYVIMPLSRDV